EMIIRRENRFHKSAVLYLKDVSQAIRVGFIRATEAEIALSGVLRTDVAQHLPELACRFGVLGRRRLDLKRVVGKVGYFQVNHQLAAIGVWVGSHASIADRREGFQ